MSSFSLYKHGKSQSRAVSLLLVLSISLTPITPAFAAFGDGTPTIQNPDAFSGDKDTPKVDGTSGAFTQRIQLDIPPGRNGLQPDLAIQYNSQNSSDGIVGYGWSLSIPYIQRLNKTGSQNFYNGSTPYFTSSLDGELVSQSTSTYKARIDETSNAYTFSGNSWTVYDKKGMRYRFGSDDTGRQYDTAVGTSSKTYKWMLQEIRDTNNNYVKFTYLQNGNEVYPYQIIYTGNGSTDGIFKATFATSTRPDTRVSYAPGFAVTTSYRISDISALINTTTVRRYLLGYGAGINGKRSLLTSFQQQGYDENNTLTTLPAMTFQYASSTSQFFAPGYADYKVGNQGLVVADTNGNGINDINNFYRTCSCNPIEEAMFIDQTSYVSGSFNPPEYWSTSGGYPAIASERGTRYLDVNADGKADIARGWQNVITGQEEIVQRVYVSTYATSTGYAWGTTVSTTSSLTIPVFAVKNSSFTLTGGVFGDFNGDGLPDYAHWVPSWLSAETFLGNGTAWDNATTTIFSPVQPFPSTAPTATASQLIDVNGDGLDDWLYSDTSKTYVRLNTGTGWEGSDNSAWTFPTSTLYKSPDVGTTVYYDRGIRFMDINGDGLPDFVRAYQLDYIALGVGVASGEKGDYKAVYLNTGNGWATSTAYTLPAYIATGIVSGGTWDWGTYSYNEYGNWIGNGQQKQDVLTTVTNAKGGSTSVIYTNTTQHGGRDPELPYSLLVATAVGIYDGRGNVATTSYTYSGGLQYTVKGVRDRKFAGFSVSTTSAPDGVTGTYFSQGMSTSTHLGEQAGGYEKINHPFRKDIFDLSGNLIQKTFYRWDVSTNGAGSFVNLGRTVIEDYALSGTHRDSATDYLYASTTNELVKITEFGEVTGNNNGTFTDSGADKRTTNITYAASTSANLSVPKQKTILDYNNATTSDNKLYYDWLSFGSITKGNNTREEAWISGSTYASSTKGFNTYGLVASSTDRRGKITTNVFEYYNLYVASSTNPLSQQTQFTYDYSLGKVKQTTDPNSRLTRNLYDGVGRLREIDQSNVTTPSTFATTTAFTYTDSSTPPSTVRKTDYLTSTTTVDTYSYFDGLGRLIQERKASQYASLAAATDRTYNQVSKLASQSLPYFSSGTSFTSPISLIQLFTTYTYDALQRPLTAANAVGTTTNVYANWTTTTTDPNGNLKDYTRDPFGNLASVVEHTSSLATTTYSYDSLNNLATTTDALGNVRRFTYDGISRRITAQDLHYATDTTFGTWSYTYDDAGNMTSQTDPKSQVVNRTYDSVNRLLTEDYTGLSGTEVTNIYDTCTKGIGYICTASSTAASSTTIYDALGRAATTTIRVLNIPYSTGYAYDLQSNVTTLTYPNSSQVAYWYNTAGAPSRVTRKAPGTSTFSDIVSRLDYGPHGQVVNTLFGNGASTTRWFDPNAVFRLSSLQTMASTTYIQNFAYTYDAIGNITQLMNTGSTTAYAITQFSYDQLYRLTVASTTPVQAAATPTTTIAIMDTLPVTYQTANPVSGISFPYTVPSGGTNKLLVAQFCMGGGRTPTATQNGVSLTLVEISGTIDRCHHWYGYLANPSSGTFSLNWTGPGGDGGIQLSLMTLQNAYQTNPIDASNVTSSTGSFGSISTNVTTTQSNILLLDESTTEPDGTDTYGTGQTQTHPKGASDPGGHQTGSYKNALTAASQTMTRNFSPNAGSSDLAVIAIKELTASSTPPASILPSPPYRQSFTYDQLGNLLSITNGATSSPVAATPSVLDTLPVTNHKCTSVCTSDSFTYTVPAGGSNKLLVVLVSLGLQTITASQNGVALTCSSAIPGPWTRSRHYICYLANPTSGTFSISWPSASSFQYSVFTLQDAAQSSPVDAMYVDKVDDGATLTTSTSTSVGNDLLIDDAYDAQGHGVTTATFGTGQTQLFYGDTSDPNGLDTLSYKAAASTPGTESMTRYFSPTDNADLAVVAIKLATGLISSTIATTSTYTYAGTGYANPDAVTQIADGRSTTTYAYDSNGNVTQSGIWTYLYDYLNRITSIGGNSSTSTFGYDVMGARVYQAATTSTTTYASKFYSIASTTISGTSWATTTSYVWLGDTLLATVDQQFKTGSATGTAKTRYVHPDHLGSTNVVTDEGDNLVQTLDYYPFGATRISVSTSTNEQRKYIGQFTDQQTGLDYLNARYYDSGRGQFVTQDPVFWEIAQSQDGKTALIDPQALNSYAYAGDNPIVRKDPLGRLWQYVVALAIPDVAGDPTFNADGTVSASPQQQSLGTNLFLAGFVAPSGAGTKAVKALDAVAPQVAGKALELASYGQNQLRRVYQVADRTRITDNIDDVRQIIYEAKNVAYQSLTKQVRDAIAYAQQINYKLVMTVQDTTRLSGPLLQQIQQGKIQMLSVIRDELKSALQTLEKLKNK